MTFRYVWIPLSGFVGTQLARTLRPFLGSPGTKFSPGIKFSPGMKFGLFRDIDRNFYAEIVRTLPNLF